MISTVYFVAGASIGALTGAMFAGMIAMGVQRRKTAGKKSL